eukprot:jgi/Phyca11/21138/fgenesh1_pg.PHYCAscaffold_83_\
MRVIGETFYGETLAHTHQLQMLAKDAEIVKRDHALELAEKTQALIVAQKDNVILEMKIQAHARRIKELEDQLSRQDESTLAKKGVYPCAISKATNLLASKAYTLQVSWEPLKWFELMNLFQFTVDVYLGFFTLVAMASMILGFIIWVINRLFTKMKRPPKFRMKLLLKNVATPPPIGIFMACIPIFLAYPLNNPSAASFEATAGDWLDQISLDKTRVQKYKHPFSVEADKEDEEEENEFWDPRAWKRANFLLTTICFMCCMLVFWEFSYSPAFTENIYGYLILFKIMRAVAEFVLESFLHEKLLVMPFAVVLSVSESMMAMGSADFIGFTLFYFFNLTLMKPSS